MAELKTLRTLLADANLVAYYKLEDTADSKGSATLTNNGSVSFGAGKFSNGANLGTSNSSKYLSAAGLTSAGKETAITISMWVKMNTELSDGQTKWLCYLAEVVANYIAFEIRYARSGSTYSVYANRRKEGVANEPTSNVNGALGTSSWHHLVLTYDGTTLKVYVDAGTPGTAAASGNGSGAGSEQAEFRLGKSRNIDNVYVDAQYDDVAVWSRALTATEIKLLFKENRGNFFQLFK